MPCLPNFAVHHVGDQGLSRSMPDEKQDTRSDLVGPVGIEPTTQGL